MGWIIESTGLVVDGNTLKRMAAAGTIDRNTMIRSKSKNRSVRAGDISSLVWPDEGTDVFADFPPIQSPPSYFSSETTAFQADSSAFTEEAATPTQRATGILDLAFEVPITPVLASLIWFLWLVGGSLVCVLAVVFHLLNLKNNPEGAAARSIGMAVASYILTTILLRVVLECVVVFFKIAEHLRSIARK
jgi:hypothetical protein